MSFLNSNSDNDGEKSDLSRGRLVSKLAAHRISAESKWSGKNDDDCDSEISNSENFLTKGKIYFSVKSPISCILVEK